MDNYESIEALEKLFGKRFVQILDQGNHKINSTNDDHILTAEVEDIHNSYAVNPMGLVTSIHVSVKDVKDLSFINYFPKLNKLVIDHLIIGETDTTPYYKELSKAIFLRSLRINGEWFYYSSSRLEGLRHLFKHKKNFCCEIPYKISGTTPNLILKLQNLLGVHIEQSDFIDIFEGNFPQSYVTNDAGQIICLKLTDIQLDDFLILREFKDLKFLNLNYNKIKEINTADLNYFQGLIYLSLTGNPIENIPREIYDSENCLERITIYLNSIVGKSRYLHQAKMILIGNGEVGKSSIRLKLLDPNAVLPTKSERTQGLEVAKYTVKDVPPSLTLLKEKIDFNLHIYDFGGQGRYREIQQLFCGRQVLYLFVTSIDDSPSEEDYIGFEYWLSMARAFGYDQKADWDSPIIHILNKTDKGNKAINEEGLLNIFDNIHEFIKISCKTLENFDILKNKIQTALPKISTDIFTNQFNEKWFAVKDELEKMKYRNHITKKEYLAICKKNDLTVKEGNLWLDYLDRAGTLIYFRDIRELSDFVILNPIWVKEAMYRCLDNELTQGGILKEEYFNFIWPKDASGFYTKFEKEKLLKLMIAYKFCYRSKYNIQKPNYLIPALFTDIKPDIPHFLTKYEYELRVEYTPFLPAGTLNKLMVDLHDCIYKNFKWKNGCILYITDKNTISYAVVSEKWDEKAVYIGFVGEWAMEIYNLIKNTLFSLLDELKKLKFLDKLNACIKVKYKNEFYPLQAIKDFGIENLYPFLFDKENLPAINQRRQQLLTVPTQKKIFISYSNCDISYKQELEKYLKPLANYEIAKSWSCEEIVSGKWDSQIKKEIEDAHVYLFLLSIDFITSEYIMREEVSNALLSIDNNQDKKIICILIKNFPLKEFSNIKKFTRLTNEDFNNLNDGRSLDQILSYQILPYAIEQNSDGSPRRLLKPLSQWQFKDDAYTQITKKISELF